MTAALASSWLRLPAFWRVHLVFWAFIFLYAFLSRVFLLQSVPRAFAFSLAMESLGFLASSQMRRAYRRLGLTNLGEFRTIAWTVLLCLGGALLQSGASTLLRWATGWSDPSIGGSLQGPLVPFTFYIPVFLGWSLGYFWITAALAARTAQQRAAAAELEALRAEVQRLRGQLDPHFLFNALNGIGAEIPDQPETARRMLEELADYLRLCLDNRDRAVTTVADELEALDAYMAIERARLGSRVGFAVDAEPSALARAMPSFLLQPLVENAIKHGRRQGLVPSIRVEARAEGEWLHLSVRNNGRLATDWQARGEPGIGLANLRQRLALHFPGRHDFALRQEEDGVAARIALQGAPAGA